MFHDVAIDPFLYDLDCWSISGPGDITIQMHHLSCKVLARNTCIGIVYNLVIWPAGMFQFMHTDRTFAVAADNPQFCGICVAQFH